LENGPGSSGKGKGGNSEATLEFSHLVVLQKKKGTQLSKILLLLKHLIPLCPKKTKTFFLECTTECHSELRASYSKIFRVIGIGSQQGQQIAHRTKSSRILAILGDYKVVPSQL
jgi:hypothetical protein